MSARNWDLRQGNRNRDLRLGMRAVEEQFRRAVFNVIARNQDDHVKNISFLMDRSGHWSLSPAYDVAYAYYPHGTWTREHQMSLAGRQNGFEREDLLHFAANVGVKKRKALTILDEVCTSVRDWGAHAEAAGVAQRDAARIEKTFRSNLMSSR